MITFKTFLFESGNATKEFGTERANADDIKRALDFVSKALKISVEQLKDDLLGSTQLTLLGKRKDSGDIDIALLKDSIYPESANKAMLLAGAQGSFNSGTKVGSYAVPVNNKKVQVDLMFVDNKEWAKFAYHSSQNNGSKYSGAVRNILLTTALAHTQEQGKDFVIRKDGKTIARASKSLKLDSGMERMFKIAKVNSKGEFNKSLEKVSPEELNAFLKSIGKDIKFSNDVEKTTKPDDVASFIFGENVKAKDIMTAENVIKYIKTLKNSDEIITSCKKELTKLKMEVPEEL